MTNENRLYTADGLPHGPFRPIMMTDIPVLIDYIDRHVDAPIDHAKTDEEKVTLLESRWAADRLGEAVLDTHQAGKMSDQQMHYMMKILEFWYRWPMDNKAQISTTRKLNAGIDKFARDVPIRQQTFQQASEKMRARHPDCDW